MYGFLDTRVELDQNGFRFDILNIDEKKIYKISKKVCRKQISELKKLIKYLTILLKGP